MQSRSFEAVLDDVHTLFSLGTLAAIADDVLLEQFLSRADHSAQAAFEVLVRRHGPMVLRVCHGVLADTHAAEDAFQATFVVLARQARSIRKSGSVASWLYGVARRVAQRAKVDEARRAVRERRSAEMAATVSRDSYHQPDLVPEIQEEVDRLPDKYRAAVVLCYMEGLTHEEAAGQLRLPVGTVKVRLSRARERLRGRLLRRGLAPTLLAATAARSATASVPASLVELTIRAAVPFTVHGAAGASASVALLVEGVLKAMFLSKLKTAAVVLAASLTAMLASFLAMASLPAAARSVQEDGAAKVSAKQFLKKADPAAQHQQAGIMIETVKRNLFVRKITPNGIVQAREQAELYPKISGVLTNVSVEIGDTVKRGQVLAVISQPELALAVDKSAATVEQARAKIVKAQSLILVAESELKVQKARVAASESAMAQAESALGIEQRKKERTADFVRDLAPKEAPGGGDDQQAKRQAIAGQNVVDAAQLRLQTAQAARLSATADLEVARAGIDEAGAKIADRKADLAETQAGLRIAQADLEMAKIQQSYTRLEAPFDGVVTRRRSNLGEYVRSGDAGSIISLVGTRLMRVVVDIDGQHIPYLDNGDPASVSIASARGIHTYEVSVSRSGFALDPSTNTLRAEIDLENVDGRLRPGLTADVTIVLDKRPNLVTIPTSALAPIPTADGAACYLLVDGRAVFTRITVGEMTPERVEVLEGLHQGDVVIVNPTYQGIKDQQPISKTIDVRDTATKGRGGPARPPGHT